MSPKRTKILLIEDNPGDVRLIQEMLRQETGVPYDLDCADRLSTGLERLAKADVSLVLLDLGLPDSQGLDTLNKLRTRAPELPIVVLTGLADEGRALEAVKQGADDYLLKTEAMDSGRLLLRCIGYAIERRQSQEALRLSEERYRTILEEMEEGYYELDLNGNLTFCNDSYRQALGYSPEEITGMNYADFTAQEDRDRMFQMFTDIYRMATPMTSFTYQALRKDGRTITVESAVSPLRDKEGQIIGFRGIGRDITDRKRADEALQESEEKYRQLVENATDAIIVAQDGMIKFANRRATEMTGYSVEELCSIPPAELIHPDDREMAIGFHYARATREEIPRYRALRLIDKEGNIKWVERSAGRLPWEGSPASLIIDTDITERKLAEKGLQESEEKYRRLFELGSDALFLIEVETGRIIDLNDSAIQVYGYSREEALQMKNTDFSAEPDKTRRATLESEEQIPIRYHIRKDGTVFPTDISVAHFAWRGKEVCIAAIRDITERKQAEETLRQSEERYRTILEDMQDNYFELDVAGNYTFVNDASCRAMGYSREEMMGMSHRDLMLEEDAKAVYQDFNRMYRTGESIKGMSYRFIQKDGSTGFGELSASLLRNHEGEVIGFRGVGRDVTERVQTERERKELEQRAQLSSRLASVGEMASGIAHEINNPLTGVIGFAELLAQSKDIPEDMREGVEVICEGAQRVAGIVKRLLTFARQTKSQREYVSINELIGTTLALRTYELATSNIAVTTCLDPNLPPTIADGGHLQQVFLNLIINAEREIKLARGGGGNLLIQTETVDGTVRVSVKDDGPGIAKKNLQRVFDPFFTTRKAGQGTGLGLSVCYGIVLEHGGTMYVESQLHKGATFVVELPVVTEPGQMTLPEPVVEETQAVLEARILVVDDEPTVRRFLSKVLTDEGHEVQTVANADDALEEIENESYSLILLDIKMPGTSGTDLYKRFQETAPSLAKRIVFITGDVIAADTIDFLSQTKAPYIAKPFRTAELKKEINRILREPKS